MSKWMKALLCVTIVFALSVMFVLGKNYFSSAAVIREKTAELEQSRNTWEQIAAEKEALQAELKTVNEQLREAELTRSEALENAEKLQGDIGILEQEIAELKNK